MPDDVRDLGNRPVVNALIGLMDEMDRKEREVVSAVAEIKRAAHAALDAGAHELAATLFDQVADEYRRAGLYGHNVAEYERRAADCRSLKGLQKRRKR